MNIKEKDLGNPTIHNGPADSASISSGGSSGMTDGEIVAWLESEHPELSSEFKKIQREQYVIFARKQKSYGLGNIMLGGSVDNEDDRLGARRGLVIRMNDKMQRLINLVLKGRSNPLADENVNDTFLDLSVYGIISLVVDRMKWK